MDVEYLDHFLGQAKRFLGDRKQNAVPICLYTMEWGERPIWMLINQAIKHEGKSKTERCLSFVNKFYSALKSAPDFTEICWRGTDIDLRNRYKKDQVLTWNGFSSCSKSYDFIYQSCVGTSGTLFKIKAISGKDISEYTMDTITEEVLLMPGISLVVIKVDMTSNHENITLVELEEQSGKRHENVKNGSAISQALAMDNYFGKYTLFI